jgi:hypothetical protein
MIMGGERRRRFRRPPVLSARRCEHRHRNSRANHRRVESVPMCGRYTLRRIDVARLHLNAIDAPIVDGVFVVAAWVPPLILAYPTWLTVRRWRRGRTDAGHGFDVAGVA